MVEIFLKSIYKFMMITIVVQGSLETFKFMCINHFCVYFTELRWF